MFAPNDIAKEVVKAGKSKASLSIGRMLLLGMFAGAFIALAGVGATFGNVYVNKVVGACIFPAGLAMVVVAGSELFTGNNLMIVALLKREITFGQMLKNWFFVYLGNLIGAVLVAGIVVLAGTFDGISDTVINTAVAKTGLGFGEAMLRGVLCNFLVCIAVWMAFGAKTVGGKIAAVFFPVMLFVLCGFEHSIADMFYVPAGLFSAFFRGMVVDGLSVWSFLIRCLLPVTIGNVIGGAALVGTGYYLSYLRKTK